MPDEDPSVLGNLPRSRPGRRSDKRGSARAKPPTQSAQVKAQRAAAKAKTQRSRPAASKPRARATGSSASRPPRAAQPASSDPVTGAIRLAGQVAGTGFKVAGAVLKRLPRP